MEEIFKQYGTPIIIVTVIVALIAIFTFLLSNNDGGFIFDQFKKLITDFFNEARFTPAHSTIVVGMSLLG